MSRISGMCFKGQSLSLQGIKALIMWERMYLRHYSVGARRSDLCSFTPLFRCPRYVNLPSYCTYAQDPNDPCCQVVSCNPSLTPTPRPLTVTPGSPTPGSQTVTPNNPSFTGTGQPASPTSIVGSRGNVWFFLFSCHLKNGWVERWDGNERCLYDALKRVKHFVL